MAEKCECLMKFYDPTLGYFNFLIRCLICPKKTRERERKKKKNIGALAALLRVLTLYTLQIIVM